MAPLVRGWLAPGPEADLPPAPFVRVAFSWSGSTMVWISFLVDTGADRTTLHPGDALRIGFPVTTHPFGDDQAAIEAGAAGGGSIRLTPVEGSLRFRRDDGRSAEFPGRVWLAEPPDRSGAAAGAWNLPSLLGRDFLRSFRVCIDETADPAVSLELPD